ncbi:hypothetical protein SODALDRAFT_332585 [Sodiomyces alkalinus F11]|uniref:Uncharacterized protein n=1 Tax=Sodiomyces alkalinus (strain CBS 110278 / VKM F-3762 / F11) TaxID=1314773 RepID=A0A3N2PXC5_SODAK|nr:hypothetical protein SODALDRAFT_332585 [Sodiomyces alkalinus F11]ROT39161.1 hypothetical protein SODALDRAFT_332585 [Sodiomyces alkalinus F11]
MTSGVLTAFRSIPQWVLYGHQFWAVRFYLFVCFPQETVRPGRCHETRLEVWTNEWSFVTTRRSGKAIVKRREFLPS